MIALSFEWLEFLPGLAGHLQVSANGCSFFAVGVLSLGLLQEFLGRQSQFHEHLGGQVMGIREIGTDVLPEHGVVGKVRFEESWEAIRTLFGCFSSLDVRPRAIAGGLASTVLPITRVLRGRILDVQRPLLVPGICVLDKSVPEAL